MFFIVRLKLCYENKIYLETIKYVNIFLNLYLFNYIEIIICVKKMTISREVFETT